MTRAWPCAQIAIDLNLTRALISSTLLVILLPYGAVRTQSQLPAPSRTIYKCKVGGTVIYSDEPCIGAQRLDVVPNRGVDRLSDQSRIGNDVARERRAEQLAQAVEPITGMSPDQFATAVRRHSLAPAIQKDCGGLESAILGLEQAKKSPAPRPSNPFSRSCSPRASATSN
jgi:hypothetical protein